MLSFALAVEIYSETQRYQREEAELTSRALSLSRIAGLSVRGALDAAREVLITVSMTHSVQTGNWPACDELAKSIRASLHPYDFLSVVNRDGRILCSTTQSAERLNISAEQSLIDRAVATREFVIGTYGRAQVTGRQVLRLAYPVSDPHGVTEVVTAGLDLRWLNDSIAEWELPSDSMVNVVDRSGLLLAHYPDATTVGSPIAEGLQAIMTISGSGTQLATGRDGVRRVYGYVPVNYDGGSGVVVSVGLDSDNALADAMHAVQRRVEIFCCVLLFAAFVICVYLRRGVERPIMDLRRAAARWQAGDWATRAEFAGVIPEFGELADAFNAMAETVAARERELRQSQEHFADAQRLANTGSDLIDLASGAIRWSDETYRIYGERPDTFAATSENILGRVHPDDRDLLVRTRDEAWRGLSTTPIEFRIIRSDGAIRHLYRKWEVICDATGQPIQLLGTTRDVTELREAERRQSELEAQLHQAQKMEALGTLAGGIAHDLNNSLMPVIALPKLMLSTVDSASSDQADQLRLILQGGERAQELVRRILAFARKSEPQRVEINLATLLMDSLSLLRSTLPATITIRDQIEPVPPLFADEGQLNQVVVNLVTNAAQAIGDRVGTITVEVALAEHALIEDGRPKVRLSITDTGCGMDEDTRRRVFEPFFTTKPVNQGTGLGLSVVHGIITGHGGRIVVDSRPGHGTRFDIYLPIPARAPSPPD